MSYNSEHDELFLADYDNEVVRSMRVRKNAGDLRDVYRVETLTCRLIPECVCHMNDTNTLLVCEWEEHMKDRWLVALRRSGSEWRETHRLQLQSADNISHNALICCALSDSRVLIGQNRSTYLELMQVDVDVVTGARIAPVERIDVTDKYKWFSATCESSDTRVVMSYSTDRSVRVYRLRGGRLEELARTQLQRPYHLLWLADRLVVTEWNAGTASNAVAELELSGTRLERRGQLIAFDEQIDLFSWCAVDGGLVVFNSKSKELLHYSLV